MGIEIDYITMAEQVDSIRLYRNGYAFLSDGAGALFYHPRIDVTKLTPDQFPETPEGLFSGDTFIRYTFDGVEKRGAWLSLSNGMRLVVTIPVDETDGDWQTLIREIIIASLEVLLILSLFTMYYTSRITKPLEELTSAAEKVDRGNYDFTLDYCEDDEVGRLTSTFKRLSDHMKDHLPWESRNTTRNSTEARWMSCGGPMGSCIPTSETKRNKRFCEKKVKSSAVQLKTRPFICKM